MKHIQIRLIKWSNWCYERLVFVNEVTFPITSSRCSSKATLVTLYLFSVQNITQSAKIRHYRVKYLSVRQDIVDDKCFWHIINKSYVCKVVCYVSQLCWLTPLVVARKRLSKIAEERRWSCIYLCCSLLFTVDKIF